MDVPHAQTEVQIDADLIRMLLNEQHPRFASAALSRVAEGWDNVTYRVGPDHAVRVPRREVAVELLLNEQRWLPTLAGALPVAVPRQVAIGVPSDLFPWPWSVVEWIPGETADKRPLGVDHADSLSSFLLALHRPAPEDAPFNAFRGVPLEERRHVVEERLLRLGLSELVPIWLAALKAPPPGERLWIHGDLHPCNVLVADGALAGIIDWGDMTAADVATDIACVWMLFESVRGRAAFWAAYDPTEAMFARAAGWAVNFCSAFLDSGLPHYTRIGQASRKRLAADFDS